MQWQLRSPASAFNKRVMTRHKSKWIGPSQREAGICRGARARFWNRDKLYFERYTFIVNITTKRWRYLPCYTHYRRFPKQNGKVYTPPPPTNINPWLARNNGCRPTNNNPGGVLFAFILIWFEHGTRHPCYRPFSREWCAESTHRENNPPSMEDIDSPSWYMSYSSIQNIISFESLGFGTYKLFGTAGRCRI